MSNKHNRVVATTDPASSEYRRLLDKEKETKKLWMTLDDRKKFFESAIAEHVLRNLAGKEDEKLSLLKEKLARVMRVYDPIHEEFSHAGSALEDFEQAHKKGESIRVSELTSPLFAGVDLSKVVVPAKNKPLTKSERKNAVIVSEQGARKTAQENADEVARKAELLKAKFGRHTPSFGSRK